MYLNSSSWLIFIGDVTNGKTYKLKFIIQALLQFYNKYMFSSLTKTKDLLMASIGKVAFNIDGLMIHFSVEHTYAKIII